MAIIEGKKIADQLQLELKEKISKHTGRAPCLAVILVGVNPASHLYVKNKTAACENVGIISLKKNFPDTITQQRLIEEIEILNNDSNIDGILVQLPLPPQIDPFIIKQTISPSKDVDGFHPFNLGQLLIGKTDGFIPCTPLGIKTILNHYKIDVSGKHAVIVGRSNIVGKPMGALLIQNVEGGNATVTLTHSHTKDLEGICRMADILIVAIGKPLFIKNSMVKEGAIIIDVGMNRVPDPNKANAYRFVGDVDFESVQHSCSWITPVPGGVGPMTIAMLLKNTFDGYLRHITN